MKKEILLGMAAVAAAPAFGDEAGHWYATPQVGGVWTDDNRGLDDEDALYGLSIGKHVGRHWSLEVNLNSVEIDTAAGSQVDLRALSFDALRVFRREQAVSPYVTLGMGALRAEASGLPDDTNFMAQAGAGLLLRLAGNERGTRTFTLRPELKTRWDDAGRFGYFRDYVATLNFQLSFGPGRNGRARVDLTASAARAATPPARSPAVSNDDDVPASADQCRAKRSGVAIDRARGCSRPRRTVAGLAAFDSGNRAVEAGSR